MICTLLYIAPSALRNNKRRGSITKKGKHLITKCLPLLQVIPRGFEPRTHSLEGCCSIQLSYETNHNM